MVEVSKAELRTAMDENVAFRFNFAGAATTPQPPQVCLLLNQVLIRIPAYLHPRLPVAFNVLKQNVAIPSGGLCNVLNSRGRRGNVLIYIGCA